MGYLPNRHKRRRHSWLVQLSAKLVLGRCEFVSTSEFCVVGPPFNNRLVTFYSVRRDGAIVSEGTSPCHAVVKAAKVLGVNP